MKPKYYFLIILFAVVAGCGDKEKPVVQAVAKAPALMAPFKYHKLMEVSPGQYYDVLSWGRGAGNENSYLILHSDSTGKKYTTITDDLDGAITDVYNSDMDMDGNPELIIQAKGTDSINFTHIYAYEFTNNQSRKLDFPKLIASKKNYRGNDNFYIQEGKLIREFPSYTGTGKDAKPTGGKYKLEYTLRDNDFSVNTLVKDSTQMDKTEAAPIVKREVVKEKPKAKKSTKKKKTETRKKKRRSRR